MVAHEEVVRTRISCHEPATRVWSALLWFEELPRPPPWLLRRLLPRPLGTSGRKEAVGDRACCRYDRGELVKQITALESPSRCEFDVVEQRLDLGGGIALRGGAFRLAARADGGCELELETRYVGGRRPRLLWRPIERWVARRFHHHLARAIRSMAAASSLAGAVA